MSQKSFDILAVGNAIIDVFSQCDDDFLRQHAIEKGGMTLIDAATSQTLFDAVMTASKSVCDVAASISVMPPFSMAC